MNAAVDPATETTAGDNSLGGADREQPAPWNGTGRRKAGRRPKLAAAQQAALVDAVLSGQRTAAQMARHYRVRWK